MSPCDTRGYRKLHAAGDDTENRPTEGPLESPLPPRGPWSGFRCLLGGSQVVVV
jgi:hypothetical protein